MLQELVPLYVDHVAVTTPDFAATVCEYLALPGARLIKGPGHNPDQNVSFAFIDVAPGFTIEVLGQPEGEASPIATHVANGGGAYHICYAVADLERAIERAEGAGAHVVVPPRGDTAFSGRRVAFLMHAAHGLFELVEAYPALTGGTSSVDLRTGSTEAASQGRSGREVRSELARVFIKVFSEIEAGQVEYARLGETPGWDSLGHIKLMMQTEQQFEMRIPSQSFAKLTSFEALLRFIKTRQA